MRCTSSIWSIQVVQQVTAYLYGFVKILNTFVTVTGHLLTALLKNSADEEIRKGAKKSNKYRYQANRSFIISRLKWFIPQFFFGNQTIETLIDIYDDACVRLSQIQPGRKNKRNKRKNDQERKYFNNLKRVI